MNNAHKLNLAKKRLARLIKNNPNASYIRKQKEKINTLEAQVK